MAFLKSANAMVTHPRVSSRGWDKTRRVASAHASSRNLTDQAREILGGSLDPSKFLFSHCTIVASVDTEAPPDVKLGKLRVGSKTINRTYGDYLITPESASFVNNNGDSWSRKVLLASYPTFIGAHNFLEHVQIEEQSKGRIIDAVARDIGNSVYVDILVATNRKHSSLVADIKSGKISTLSMGCFPPGTMVTMADGCRRPIEDLQPGDMVLTHKGRARPIANVQIRRRPWSMRRIQAVGVPEEIVTTSTHPFFVYRAPQVCACGCGEPFPEYAAKERQTSRAMERRFKTGHDKRIFNPNANYSENEANERLARKQAILSTLELEEVEAKDLKPYDFLVFPRSRFDDTLEPGISVGRAKLLGYFLAEGSFMKYRGALKETEFSFSYDERDTYAKEVLDLLAQEFPDAKSPRLYVTEGEGRHEAIVRIYGPEIAEWFFRYGGQYGHAKRLKEEVLRWPVDLQKALMAGWLNGDGTLTSDGNSEGTTTSYDLACQLHLIAARLGAFCTVFSSASISEGLQAVNGNLVPIRQENGRLPAYTLRFGQTQSQVFSGWSDKVVETPNWSAQNNRVNDDYVMFPVTSIESEPFEGFVYDLEVEEDHSYVVEGVAVHNCSTDFTQCTHCGHVAADTTELCEHIRYSKLNTFYDDRGVKRVIAELCGHVEYNKSPEAPGGVRFIEASWVGVPAFPGAVMRNLFSFEETGKTAAEFQEAFAAPSWSDIAISKAASFRTSFEFGGEGEEAGAEGEDAAPKEEAPKAPFEDLEDTVYERVKGKVRERFEKELREKGVEGILPESMAPNDSVIKEGASISIPVKFVAPVQSRFSVERDTKLAGIKKATEERYRTSLLSLVRIASSDVALVEGVALTNAAYGVEVDRSVYRAALKVGSISKYRSAEALRVASNRAAGRELSLAELRVVVRVGTLLSHWEGVNNPKVNMDRSSS